MKLRQKVQGHRGYYGIIGNFASLQNFLDETRRICRSWLSRRRRSGLMSWQEFARLEERHALPRARGARTVEARSGYMRMTSRMP
jgi:RNA-directed DNA polymerase